eukprot:COSAG04_NODE_1180_length_7903_cov_22.082394_7_plen_288_part_00
MQLDWGELRLALKRFNGLSNNPETEYTTDTVRSIVASSHLGGMVRTKEGTKDFPDHHSFKVNVCLNRLGVECSELDLSAQTGAVRMIAAVPFYARDFAGSAEKISKQLREASTALEDTLIKTLANESTLGETLANESTLGDLIAALPNGQDDLVCNDQTKSIVLKSFSKQLVWELRDHHDNNILALNVEKDAYASNAEGSAGGKFFHSTKLTLQERFLLTLKPTGEIVSKEALLKASEKFDLEGDETTLAETNPRNFGQVVHKSLVMNKLWSVYNVFSFAKAHGFQS